MKKERGEKVRVDERLVQLKLAESRSKAQAFIIAGEVFTRAAQSLSEDSWQPVKKASEIFANDQQFQVRSRSAQDVGRGALKLRGALDAWPAICVASSRCLDIGASTGGFTQVLLESGAQSVVALDVGTNQLHERLRRDPRVTSIEQQHVLKVDSAIWKTHNVGLPFDLIVTDLSFISLEKVLPQGAPWLSADGNWIILLKPQFELDRSKLVRGVVKEEKFRQEAIKKIRRVVDGLSEQLTWADQITSPITGGDGNVEYLVWLRRSK